MTRDEDRIEYARVPGIRFRGTPYYSDSRGLDGLARFFYEQVLPHVTELERLRRLFGLPVRLVDEVLGDLVRLRYAELDVQGRRVFPVANPVPHAPFVPQPDEELWQDRVTASVIRYRDIPAIYRILPSANSPVVELISGAFDEARSYRRLPGGRLAQMLRSTSPRMAVLPNGAELETVLGCVPVADDNLWIPIAYVTIDRMTIPSVQAPELPALLTRSWSRALSRRLAVGTTAGLADPELLELDEPSGRRSPTLWDVTRLGTCVVTYVQGLVELGELRNPYGDARLRSDHKEAMGALLGRIDSVAAVELAVPSAQASHLAELWAKARQYLLIVVERGNSAAINALIETLGPARTWHATVLVIEVADGEWQAAKPRDISPDRLQSAQSNPYAQVGMCIRDGVEVRLGSLSELLDVYPLLRIVGGTLSSDLAVRCSAAFAGSEAFGFIQDLLRTGQARESQRGGVAESHPGQLVELDELRRLVNDSHALVEGGLADAKRAWNDLGEGNLPLEGEPPAAAAPLPSVHEVRPVLLRLETELHGWIADPSRLSPLAAIYRPPIAAPADMMAEAIRAFVLRRERRSLMISFDEVAADSAATWSALLAPALDSGCQVTLHLNPTDHRAQRWDSASAAALAGLEAAIPHHLLTVRKGVVRIPVVIVIDATLVVVGHRGWSDESGQDDTFVSLDAPHLGARLCTLAEGR